MWRDDSERGFDNDESYMHVGRELKLVGKTSLEENERESGDVKSCFTRPHLFEMLSTCQSRVYFVISNSPLVSAFEGHLRVIYLPCSPLLSYRAF